MKVAVGLCVLAILACASADCGCLKCNPQLQVVSPRYSPCKVIYRNNNLNLPSIAPYKLQAAVPPPPPVFVPKEYDYQMQFLPYATPYTGSVYEYGLQAAVVPPPVHIPLKNLRTGVERVVMDAPFSGRLCGSANCNPGIPKPAPIPIHLYHHHDCGCNSCRRDGIDSYARDSCNSNNYEERDTCNSCECDSCNRNRVALSRSEADSDDYKGPIIEPLLPSLCRRYAQNIIGNFHRHIQPSIVNDLGLNCRKFRRKREISSRDKRDIIDYPMNFMFKFVPNLLRGPIVHAMHTIQHNANPAVARAKAIANKHRIQAHLARSKHKLNLQKGRHHVFPTTSINLKHSSSLPTPHSTIKDKNTLGRQYIPYSKPHMKSNQNDGIIPMYLLPKPWIKSVNNLRQSEFDNSHHPLKSSKRLNRQLVEDDSLQTSRNWELHPRLETKYNLDQNQIAHESGDFLGRTNDFLKELFNVFGDKQRIPREYTRMSKQHHKSLDELKKHFHKEGYSNEDIRDILLSKMEKFNQMYERKKRSPSTMLKTSPNRNKLDEDHQKKSRRKRAVLLDTNQFQLPFFEIEDEVLDNYYENSEENIVGMKHKKKKKRRRHDDDSDMESGEEILGAGHPLHDHPFVVLLRTPLKLLHHFHDIRKNFQPILYSFPKILQSSRNYLKDFGRNLQTGVLDFASNIMGDFNNQVPRRRGSLLFPSRQRRSVTQVFPTMENTAEESLKRKKRYILKVVDEKEVQEFLEEKLGGYFDDEPEEEEEKQKEEGSEETVGESKTTKKNGEKKFIVKKLSPKLILDNNGKPFIEINGNKRPLFFGKNKNKTPILQKSKQKTHEAITSNSDKKEEEKDDEEETKNEEINGKIDEIIAQAKQKLRDGEILKSMNCDEMPTQTIKEKINQISNYIQDLVRLDCSKYAELYENLSKLEKMRKTIAEYWKKVMINEKTNDIQCKIKILKNIREMQNEKDQATKKIAEYLKTGDTFIVKKLIKLLVRLQKLQCLIQKIVDHFDNRMKIGTISDTEKEIKFVDYLSSISFESSKSEDEFVCSLKKDKHESLHKEIKFLENLRLLLQKDDTYITNEVAKQIWEMRNIEKLQLEAIEEMNVKLEDNMKIRKELKILFDLLHQMEASEEACEKLLLKITDNNVVGAKYSTRNGKRQIQRPNLAEILEKIRKNAQNALAARKSYRSL